VGSAPHSEENAMTTNRLALVVLVASAFAVACGGGESSLRDRDPAAAEACEALRDSRTAANPTDGLALQLLAGKRAAAADTPEFKTLATPLFDADAQAALEGTDSAGTQAWLLDDDKLAVLCRDKGMSVPAGRPPAS
jgi:hypothetical protein